MKLSKHFISNLLHILLLSTSPVSALKIPGIPAWIGFINPGAGGLLPAPETNKEPPPPETIPFKPTPPRLPTIPQQYCGLLWPASLDDQTDYQGGQNPKRSSRIYPRQGSPQGDLEIVDGNSTNPLHDAFKSIVPEDLIDALFSSVIGASLNRLPDTERYTWVNGLVGKLTIPKRGKGKKKEFTLGSGDKKKVFYVGQEVTWEVRWDYAENKTDITKDKGPHVNVDFSAKGGNRIKFDIRLKPTRFGYRVNPSPNGDPGPNSSESYYETLRREGSRFIESLKYNINLAVGYTGQFAQNGPYSGWSQASTILSPADQATRITLLNGLRDRLMGVWRPIANGTCSDDNPLY